jgi:hypothetical protein
MVLLVATMYLSQVTKVGIWKDSSLALLLFSFLEERERSTIGFAQTGRHIQEAVKEVRAKLQQNGGEGGADWRDSLLIEQVATQPQDDAPHKNVGIRLYWQISHFANMIDRKVWMRNGELLLR